MQKLLCSKWTVKFTLNSAPYFPISLSLPPLERERRQICLGRDAILNSYGHLFYYSAPLGGNCSSNANMNLGEAAIHTPPCLPRACCGEHMGSWSDLPSFPMFGHSHSSRGGSKTQAVSILPQDFSVWNSRSRDLAFWITEMDGLGAAGAFIPLIYRKEIQPKTSSEETQGEPWAHWNMTLASKVPRVAQVSRTFPSVLWTSLVSFQYISISCLSLSEVVSAISN